MISEKITLTHKNIKNIALLETFFLEESEELLHSHKRPCILIFPAGAYRFTSDREAEPIALQMNCLGYHAAILRYPCCPEHYYEPLLFAYEAIAYLQKIATIDEEKIVTMGFSAGGHLAASDSTFSNDVLLNGLFHCNLMPFAQVLCYPVITSKTYAHHESFHNLLQDQYGEDLLALCSLEDHVHDHLPPTFLWHTQSDPTVPVENSILYLNALIKHHINCEFHLYNEGEHGLSLANKVTQRSDFSKVNDHCASWIPLLIQWFHDLGL